MRPPVAKIALTLTLTLTLSLTLSLLALPLAGAAEAGTTDATFTLSAGSLSISVPASTVNLGSAAAGSATMAGQLGTVTVSDSRGALVAAWTATVSSTDFTTGTATANETVPKTNISYASGTPTASSGDGTFTPSVGLTLGLAGTAGAWSGVGSNEVSWNPTLTFTLLGSQVAGTYSGTITHSVA